MARLLDVSTQSIKEKIQLEGRPVNLSVALEGDGTALTNDGGTPPVYGDVVSSTLDIDVGRAILVNSITITSNAKGRVSGVIAQNAIGDWIGLSNQDEFSLAVSDGGSSTLNFNGFILGPGAGVSLRFTPYPQTGQTDPDIGMHINGIEFTADFNFNATKRLLYCGDSISWSLVGNWRPQDMGYNYSGNRKESTSPFPDYFGDELASFRLVNALRSKPTPESIRLVNKGFGGSKLATDQWFASRSGLYTLPWNLMVMQAGVNDATDVQTPLRQLTMAQRIQDMVTKRNNDGRKNYPMVFCTPPSVDDKYDGLSSRVCLDQRPPIQGTSEAYTLSPESFTAKTNFATRLEVTTGSTNAVQYDAVTGGSTVNTTTGSATFEVILDGDTYSIQTNGGVSNWTLTPAYSGDDTNRIAISDVPQVVDVTLSGDRWIKIEGDGRDNITLDGGTPGEVYRIDFITDTDLVTGTTRSAYSWIRTLDSLIDPGDSDLFEGFIEFPESSTVFLKCIVSGDQFEEIDRASLVGKTMAGTDTKFDALDGAANHFITGVPSSPTKIEGPLISGITNPDPVVTGIDNMFPSRGLTQIQLGADSGLPLPELNWPPASVVDQNDVWIKLKGFDSSSEAVHDPAKESWRNVNGFYKVIDYSTSVVSGVEVVTQIQINLDSRNSSTRFFTEPSTGATNFSSNGNEEVEAIGTRSYIAQFEGSSYNTGTNYNYFEHGSNTYDGYTIEVQLTNTSQPFNLTPGRGICFSVYQQGNVIYMNEIASGNITNVGKVVGASSLSNFWAENLNTNESGLTRLKIVRKVITDTVQLPALVADKVHLVDLYQISDLKNTVETTGGRLIYGSDNYKEPTSGLADTTLLVNDLIEDPVFKGTGNSGVNERVMGRRLHRSPKGHELLFERLNQVIGASSFTIPS
jgi:hypothetical protein